MAEVGKSRAPRLPIGANSGTTATLDDDKVLDPEPTESKEVGSKEESKEEPKTESKTEQKEGEGDNFEEIKARAKIPIPPAKTVESQNRQLFYDWLASLNPEHWVQLIWYMYRSYPKIDRADNQKYIDCGAYAITEQWILENHGSGDYMFIVNDSGRPKNAKSICTAHIKNLNHPEYPAKINPAELDTSYPGNKKFVDRWIAEGKLTTDGRPMTTNQPNGGLSDQIILRLIDQVNRSNTSNFKDPKDNAINTAIEIMAKGNQAATQMMLDQMKADDPEKLVKLVTAIMTLAPKPAEHKDESAGFMKLLIETQSKNAELMAKKDETIMQMMLKMMEAKVNPTESDGFDKTIDRFMKFMELTGMEGLGGGKKSTLEVAMQYGAPILERGLGILQNVLALKAQNAPKDGQQNSQQTQTNLPVTVASTDYTKLVETNGTGKPLNQSQESQRKDPREAMLAQSGEQEEMIKQGLKQIGPKIIEALNRRTSGDTFAESIDNFLGPMIYNQLASLGESKILEILKSDDPLWNQLKLVEPQLKVFIKEFIDYGKEVDEGEINEEVIDAGSEEIKVGKEGAK